jgi:hypothetical protein
MQTKKSAVITVRVSKDVKEKLEDESEMNGTTINSLTSTILTKHVSWDRFAEDIGFVFLAKPFLRAILDEVDEKTMKLIAVSTCRGAIRDAVLFLKGDMNIQSMLEAFDLWFEASHIPFRHIKNHKTDRYVVQHGLGKKWSIYITAVVNALLNEIDYKVVNQTSHDQSVSFDIIMISKE